jgi:N6-adenosine-specific RNA methylase IME4
LLQGWSLLLIGPFLDYFVVDAWVLDYNWRTAAAIAFGASCALAVLVNLSQFMCLGRFTAVSYQVRVPSLRAMRHLENVCALAVLVNLSHLIHLRGFTTVCY